jgi:hypothetical protein
MPTSRAHGDGRPARGADLAPPHPTERMPAFERLAIGAWSGSSASETGAAQQPADDAQRQTLGPARHKAAPNQCAGQSPRRHQRDLHIAIRTVTPQSKGRTPEVGLLRLSPALPTPRRNNRSAACRPDCVD